VIKNSDKLKRAARLAWLLILVVASCCRWEAASAATESDDDLRELKRIQLKVQRVVQRSLPVTVAITDGIGFGSGVIVSEDGLVLTAGHVLMSGGNQFEVLFSDGRRLPAKRLGSNLDVDAGMVQITKGGPFPYVELGDVRELSRGDWCVCLGHSGGYEIGRQPPVRTGRILDFEPDTIVTDAVLIGGDSGGPIFDIDGKLIGINSNIGTSIAENRHVAINTYLKFWKRMYRGDSWGRLPELVVREKPRAALGVRVDLDHDEALVKAVHPGSAAEAAGLEVGDVVVEFGGAAVRDAQHLIDLVKQRKPRETVEVIIRRDGQALQKSIRLQVLGK